MNKIYIIPRLFSLVLWLLVFPENLGATKAKANVSLQSRKSIARLPGATAPLYYGIDLKVNIDIPSSEFTGNVTIKFTVLKTTSEIVLHSKELNIREAFFTKIAKSNETDSRLNATFVHDQANEFITLQNDGSMNFTKDEIWSLQIFYKGRMRQNDEGFFQKAYESSAREKMHFGVTQFEPVGARMVLPCYDEPQYKAIFQLNLTHQKKYSAFSNMPEVGSPVENKDGTCTTIFKQTSMMPTFLLAFAIGNFVSTNVKSASIQTNVLSLPELQSRNTYAIETIPLIQGALETYLGSKISLSKLDNLALPDFEHGAMQNPGLHIYDEQKLLMAKEASVEREMKISRAIAHEYAHHWFSDLVTPAWWSYTWISEGLAVLLASGALQMVNKDWDMDQIFVAETLQDALSTDMSSYYHPLTYEPQAKQEIIRLYDKITYKKGASIFRMIQHVLKEPTFKKALRKCIAMRKNGIINSDQLIQYFNEAAMEDARFETADVHLATFVNSWTLQSGYPLVTVMRDYNGGTFRLHQEPFDEVGIPNVTQSNRVWWIPFNYVTKNLLSFTSTTIDGYLDGNGEQTISPALKMWTNTDWLILNKQQTSFYRVNYDATNWGLLTEALLKDHEKIHPINRAQLIDDAYHLVIAHRLPARVLLNILKYMVKEKEYAPWKAFEKIWSNLKYRFSERQDSIILRSFVRDISSVPYERFRILSKPKENYMKRLTRNIILNLACQSGYQQCLKDAKVELKNILMNRVENFDHDNKVTILCNGMISATHLDFSLILSLLVKSRDRVERREYMNALGCMQDPSLIRLYLTTAMKRTFDINYSHEERLYVMKSVVRKDSVSLRLAIDFLFENALEYSSINAGGKNALLEAVRDIGSHVDSKLERNFHRLVKKLERSSLLTKQSTLPVECVIKRNIDWGNRHRQPFVDWLHAYTFEKKSRFATAFANGSKKNLSGIILMSLLYIFCR